MSDPTLPPRPPACPECLQGKHGNCNGETWNPDTDDTDTCPCHDQQHRMTADDQTQETTVTDTRQTNETAPLAGDVEALARIVCPRSLAHGKGDMWCRRRARAILSDPALASVFARAATRHEAQR